MTTHLNKPIAQTYFYFFSWGYLYSAGYFAWKKMNRLFLSENLDVSLADTNP